jgi:hypothetical protein
MNSILQLNKLNKSEKHGNMRNTPILIFAYNRPEVLKITISSLFNNYGFDQHPIYIFCDGPKVNTTNENLIKIKEVQNIINDFEWPNPPIIIKQEFNLGLANSIVKGVTKVLEQFESVIVIEDDIKTSPYFLNFINKSLEFYKDNSDVISITGFNYPLDNNTITEETFFLRGTECWSWATWRRGWDLFELDAQKLYNELLEKKLFYHFDFKGKYKFSKMLKKTITHNHSWAVKWYASAYLKNKYTLYPKYSLVENIGNQGTNQSQNLRKLLGFIEQNEPINFLKENVLQSEEAYNLISNHFKRYNSITYRIFNYLKQLFING